MLPGIEGIRNGGMRGRMTRRLQVVFMDFSGIYHREGQDSEGQKPVLIDKPICPAGGSLCQNSEWQKPTLIDEPSCPAGGSLCQNSEWQKPTLIDEGCTGRREGIAVEGGLLEPSVEIMLDFRELQGTNAYCDIDAIGKIRDAVSGLHPAGLHFIDNGNYHYASLFWMEKCMEDHVLLVYDHHSDMQRTAFPGLLSCGSWIREIWERQFFFTKGCRCRAVILAGLSREQMEIAQKEHFLLIGSAQKEHDFAKAAQNERLLAGNLQKEHALFEGVAKDLGDGDNQSVSKDTEQPEKDAWEMPPLYCVTEEEFHDGRAQEKLALLLAKFSLPVYLSIDKDVLSEDVLSTNWDQGTLSDKELLHSIFGLGGISFAGIDICGGPSPDMEEALIIRDKLWNVRILKEFYAHLKVDRGILHL